MTLTLFQFFDLTRLFDRDGFVAGASDSLDADHLRALAEAQHARERKAHQTVVLSLYAPRF